MEISNIKLNKKSELYLDNKYNEDINQLTCNLKNAIFSKYISNYFIQKTEEMWILYEQRINKLLKDKHFNITCNDTRPQTLIKLEELIKQQQENIIIYKRDIDILCSSNKQIKDNNNYAIELQSIQYPQISKSSIYVPKIPRCIDRLELNSKPNEII